MSEADFKINISEYISQGWEIFKKNWKPLLSAGLVMFLIQMVPNILQAVMGWEDGDPTFGIISLIFINR